MKFSAIKQLWFWSRLAWKNFTQLVKRKASVKRPTPNLSRRPHGSFAISQDSHPRKVQRWMNRGGSVTQSTSDLAAYAKRHLHPRSKYAS